MEIIASNPIFYQKDSSVLKLSKASSQLDSNQSNLAPVWISLLKNIIGIDSKENQLLTQINYSKTVEVKGKSI